MVAGDTLQGRRISLRQFYSDSRQPGDYCGPIRKEEGPENAWYICDPAGRIGGLYKHTVTEHDDGTISVDPSIDDPPDGWHGYLKRGVWRQA
jgi:hypothetical protein